MSESKQAADNFQKSYEETRKKFPKLPPLDELDEEWDILETIAREKHFPRNILRYTRWHIGKAIHGWGCYLHEFILPSQQSAVSMEEYNYFNEDEKKQVVELMNWIMLKQREMNVLQLDEDDEKTAQWISDCWEEWHSYKPRLRKMICKNAEVWREKVSGLKQ